MKPPALSEPAAQASRRVRLHLGALLDRAIHFALTNRPTSAAVHVVLIVLANYLAFALRFDGAIPPASVAAWKQTVVLLVLVRSLVFVPLRLYEGFWRYTGIWDLQRIVLGVFLSSVSFYGLVTWGASVGAYPRSVYLIDAFLLIGLMGGVRLARRVVPEARNTVGSCRVLVLGARYAGDQQQSIPSRGPDPNLDDIDAHMNHRSQG